MTTETVTFKEAYGVLQRHATTLRDQKEPNIDELLQVVTESVQSFEICKQRIEAVDRALADALKTSGNAVAEQ